MKESLPPAVIYKKLLGYVKMYWVIFVIALIADIVYSGVDAWFVHFLKPLLNKGFVQHDVSFISMLPLLILGVFILRGGAGILSTYYMARVSRNIIMNLRAQIFRHFQRLPASYFDQNSGGNLLSTIVYNVEQVANASADALTTSVQAFFFIIGLLVVMFRISWQLSLIYFFAIPLIVVVVRYTSKRVRNLSLGIQESMGNITSISEESIDGYKVVRTFGGEEYEKSRFEAVNQKNRQREMKVVMAKALSVSGVQLLAAIALATIMTFATSHSMGVKLSAGEFASMIAAMLAILKPMKDLTNVNTKVQRGLAGAQSVFALLEEPLEIDEGKNIINRAIGKIEFKHVDFKYDTSDKNVLHDISFQIEPGSMIALVGRSGSGKSSIVNLLLRFYPLQSGEILIDDKDITQYALPAFRQQFAYVSQQVVLFNDTIANNIAYGSMRHHSREDIVKAAEAAHAMTFINEFPEGLDTLIGDNGVLLSGGQRQRIAIARAILKDAPILLLDEATSALDTESERHIQAALDALMKGRTSIVVAHRLSTIQKADNILVLDEGRIVESGKHQALLDKQGQYANFYQLQFESQNESA